MNPIYQQIKTEAAPMQDLREDEGHAETVTSFAIKLSKLIKCNEKIVIPAAILHDIGYYKMDGAVLKNMMAGKLPQSQSKEIKESHMKNGAIWADEILRKLKYDKKLIPAIVNIVKTHDIEGGEMTNENKVVRDADKLWRFSRRGFNLDVRRRRCAPSYWYDYLKKNIDKPGYFLTTEAKQIATEELRNRSEENDIKSN